MNKLVTMLDCHRAATKKWPKHISITTSTISMDNGVATHYNVDVQAYDKNSVPCFQRFSASTRKKLLSKILISDWVPLWIKDKPVRKKKKGVKSK